MNQEEFVSIIKDHQRIIYKICNVYSQQHDRSDLEQEVLIQIWKSLGNYNGQVKLSTWIYKVALNTGISYYRKGLTSKRKQSTIDTFLFAKTTYDYEKDENIRWLYSAIDQLKSIEKAIVLLFLDHYSYEQISTMLGLTKTNVATRLNRIKVKLRKVKQLDNE